MRLIRLMLQKHSGKRRMQWKMDHLKMLFLTFCFLDVLLGCQLCKIFDQVFGMPLHVQPTGENENHRLKKVQAGRVIASTW